MTSSSSGKFARCIDLVSMIRDEFGLALSTATLFNYPTACHGGRAAPIGDRECHRRPLAVAVSMENARTWRWW